MTAPTLAHATQLRTALQSDQRQQRAFRLLRTLRSHNAVTARLFVIDAFMLLQLDQLVTNHEEVREELGVSSFYALVADPANGFDSITKVMLQLQTVDLYWSWLFIDRVKLYPVGRAKFGILNPEMEAWRRDVTAGKRTLQDAKAAGEYWLASAQTNSVSALQTLMMEQSIQYARENPTSATTRGFSGTFTTLREPTILSAGVVRNMPHEELLGFLGLTADIDDDRRVIIQVSSPNK